MAWPYKKIKECCNVIGGATPRRDVPEYWGNDIPWITPKDISNLDQPILEDAPEYISQAGFDNTATYLLPKGSILLTSRAPIGNVAIAGREMCTNQGFKSLVPCEGVNSNYLYHCMKRMAPKLEAVGNGATFKEVSKSIVEGFEIPLPPLPEQKRIAAILDKADAIRRKRRQATQFADDLLRSVFLDMFADPHVNPMNWPKVTLSDIVSINAPMVDPREEEYLNMIHVGPDRIVKKSGEILPALTAREEGLISGKFLFNSQHVLYTKIRPYLRKVALPTFSGLCSADMYPVLPDTRIITREYLWSILISKAFISYYENLPDRANIPKINRKELLAFKCMLPPIKLQEKYSRLFRLINDNKNKIKIGQNMVSSLTASLSQRAFRGEN